MISVTITRNGELLDEIIFGDDVAHEGSTSGVYRDVVRDCTDAVLWQQVAHVAQIVAARGNLPHTPETDARSEANFNSAYSASGKGTDVPPLAGEALQRKAGDRTVIVEDDLGRLKPDSEQANGRDAEHWRMLGRDGRGRHRYLAPRVASKDSAGNDRTIILLGALWWRAVAKRGA